LKAGEVMLPKDYLAADLTKLSGSCACRVDGLIGADFFHGRVVQIDFVSRTVSLLAELKPISDQEKLPLKQKAGALLVSVGVNGSARWLRLDTGCASNLQWVTRDSHLKSQTPKLAVGLADLQIPQALASVQLGGISLQSVPTGLHSKPIF